MFLEENKAVVRRHYEVGWNQKKLESVDETHAKNCVHHDLSNPLPIKGSEKIKKRLATVMEAFPDIQFSILDMIAEQDKVVVYWQVSGTHQGVFAGIEPTGKKVKIHGIIINRLENKKIVENWVVRDTFGLMVQLGVITPPEVGQR
jgi:steroid delta-isomerase-like uncharacterized protein